MKKTLLLTGALFSILYAQAQQSPTRNPFLLKKGNDKSRNYILGVLKAQTGNTAQKPTGTKQRVTAQSSNGDGDLDSMTYRYSGVNGSVYDYNKLGYNEDFELGYAPMYMDPSDVSNPMDLLADSISSYEDGTWYLTERAFYRPDKKIDSLHIRSENIPGPGPGVSAVGRRYNTYNAGGLLTASCYLNSTDNGATFDTTSKAFFVYNAAGTKILSDTVMRNSGSGWDNTQVRVYHYNANNKLDTLTSYDLFMSATNVSRDIHDYYNDGRIRKIEHYYLSTSGWESTYMDTLGYTPGADYVTYWESRTIYNSQEFRDLTLQYPGTGGLPDSTINSSKVDNDPWEMDSKLKYTYNSFDNPEKISFFSMFEGQEEPEGQMMFYYETYEEGLSIKPLADNNNFSVYPNPFTGNLSIDWKGAKANEDVTLRIVNILGQQVFQSAVQLRNGTNTVQLPEVNAGNYVLLIQGKDGKTWSQKLVKQ
jgi:hypothetical protein